MSRDFLHTPGREFWRSTNRDRRTRAGQQFETFPSIELWRSRWGAYDWCLSGGIKPDGTTAPRSGTRYRKIRATISWGAIPSSRPAGTRIEEFSYGDGMVAPSRTIISADPPYQAESIPFVVGIYPYDERNTATMAFGFTDGASGGPETLVAELIDPEPDFASGFVGSGISILGGLLPFRFYEFNRDAFFWRYDDKAMWVDGPAVFETENATFPGYPMTRRATTRPGFIFNSTGLPIQEYALSPGGGSYSVTGQNAAASPVRSGSFVSVECGNVSRTLFVLPFDLSRIYFNSYYWAAKFSKVLVKTSLSNTFAYRVNSPNASSYTGALEIACQPSAPIPDGVLMPVAANLVTDYLDKSYVRKCFPPWSRTDGNSHSVPPIGIAPSCFTI